MKKNSQEVRIAIASPHSRHDFLEKLFLEKLDLEILRIHCPANLDMKLLTEFSPRYIFFPHWSWIIPEEIYKKFECVIFHMTDLPYGRGGSPLQNLIIRGHKETKLTAFRCDKNLDAGPIYAKRSLSLNGTAEEILFNAAKLTGELIEHIVIDNPSPVDQIGEYIEFKRRSPEDGNLEALTTLQKLYDYIRMLDAEGYPSAFIENNHFKFEFRGAILNEDDLIAEVKITRRVK